MSSFRHWIIRRLGGTPPAAESVRSNNCGLVDSVMGGWFQNETGELFKGFPIGTSDTVLDLGCGAGGSSLFCARRGAHVIFTDSDAAKVEALTSQVQAAGARKAEGIVSDSVPLPVADDHVSKVVALEVLEHVDKPEDVLRELVRVGRSGALYFLSVPDAASEKLQRVVAPEAHFQPPNHQHVFSREEFGRLVENAGLEIVSRHYYGFFWTFWMLLYWTIREAEGHQFDTATHDQLGPPYDPLLDDWARVWHQLVHLPGGVKVRSALDERLPKTQIILARKPEVINQPPPD